MKETKSRLFVRPIGHIKRHLVPTSSAISHINEPSFFQQNDQHEHSHYRTEFKMKTNDGSIGRQRLSSPNRRNKPHPVEVYHLQRLRSGLVCDVRTKLPINSLNNNILGISPLSPSSELSSWTKTVYKAYDWKALAHVAESKIRRFPAIGIVPTCLMTSKTSDDAMKKEDHWLPGICFHSLKISHFYLHEPS